MVSALITLPARRFPAGQAPRVLLICPPPTARLSRFTDMFDGATDKSRQLAKHYRAIANERQCQVLAAGQTIVSSDINGIHFDAPEQQNLAEPLRRR